MKKLFLLLIGCISLMVSCQNDGFDDVYGMKNHYINNPADTGLDSISAKALAFVTDLHKETRSGMNGISVASVYPWRVCDMFRQTRSIDSNLSTDTLLYIVNFDNDNGFALVSACDSFDGVVAYIESGSLHPNDEIDNPGFQLFLERMPRFLSEYCNPEDSAQICSDPFPRPDPGPLPIDTTITETWRITEFYSPMLSTEWGQLGPYNRLCYTENGDRAVAGCGAIAASQIVAYHQYPSSYGNHNYLWNDILSGVSPQTENGKTSVSELVSDVGQLIRTNYGMLESSSYTDSVKYCWEAFGYHYQLQSFNNDSCFVDFQNDRPVYMRGTRYVSGIGFVGHAWVIDGGFTKERTLYSYNPLQVSYEVQKFIHCNWGWDGDDNGYYIAGAFETKYDSNGCNPTPAYPFFNSYMRTYNRIYPLNP